MNTSSEHLQDKVITILLVDDHTMMREGTRRLLEEDSTLTVIGEAQDGTQAVALSQHLQPDVVIMDIAMKGMNGFEATRALLALPDHQPSILVLTAYDQLAYVQTMLKLGVKGYWLKSARSADIRQAVHDTALGKKSIDPEIQQLLRLPERGNKAPAIEPLTSREREVLQLVTQGLRNIEISQQLCISIKTVETHLTSLYGKLGVQSRAEAIALAQKQGLLLER